MFWDNDPPELKALKEKRDEYSEKADDYEKLKNKLNTHQEDISYSLSSYKDILPTSAITTLTEGDMMDMYNRVVEKFNKKCTALLEDLEAGLKLLETKITSVETLLSNATQMEAHYQQLIDNFTIED